MSHRSLNEAAFEAGLLPDKESLSRQRSAFWQKINDSIWKRVSSNAQAEMVHDGNVSWVQGFETEYETVKRNVWQRLTGAKIDGVMKGPNDEELTPRTERMPNYLLWGNSSEVVLKDETDRRMGPDADCEIIRKSLAIVRNSIPQSIAATDTNYMPGENPIMSLPEAINSIKKGINNIFSRLLRSNLKQNDPGVNVLLDLEKFWKEQVGFATLKDDEILSLTENANAQAWIVIIPPNHRLMKEEPAPLSVSVTNDLNLLYVKPFACTEEWFGVAGVHELIHLHDFSSGKESKKPSRAEYIEGEYRAFSGEICAADLATNGEFLKVIKQFAEHRNFSMDDIIRLGLDAGAMIDVLGKSVDSHLKLPKPKSFAEANMRAGLYLMASAFLVAENTSHSSEDTSAIRKKVIEAMYEKAGVLPKK